LNDFLAKQGFDVTLDFPLIATAVSALVLFVTIIYYAMSQKGDQTDNAPVKPESGGQPTTVTQEAQVAPITEEVPVKYSKVASPKRVVVEEEEEEEVVQTVVKTRSKAAAAASSGTCTMSIQLITLPRRLYSQKDFTQKKSTSSTL
jgi:hypothetical protein